MSDIRTGTREHGGDLRRLAISLIGNLVSRSPTAKRELGELGALPALVRCVNSRYVTRHAALDPKP